MSSIRSRGLVLALAAALSIGLLPMSPVMAADGPNTCAAVTVTSTAGGWLSNTIASPSDNDWYRFTVPTGRYVQVILGSLPKNYRLELYGACGTSMIASSDRPGVQYEEIYRNLAARTYHVRVFSPSLAFQATVNYALRFRILSNRLQILSSAAWTDSGGYLNIVGELLNNTPLKYKNVNVYATMLGATDQVVASRGVGADLDLVLPRARTAFGIHIKVPAGYHHYELSFGGETTLDMPIPGLRVHPGAPYTSYGTRYLPGTVSNTGAEVSQFTFISCVLYDARGNVLNGDWTYTTPSTVNPGETKPFKCWFSDHWANANRTVFFVEGS
jgi:hypothetical protein